MGTASHGDGHLESLTLVSGEVRDTEEVTANRAPSTITTATVAVFPDRS